MRYVLLIIFYLSITSCLTQKKVNRYLNNNEEFASTYCASKFPITTDTFTIYETDTLRLNYYNHSIDTLIVDTSGSKEKIITEIKYRVKEIIRNTPPLVTTKIIEKENTAKIKSLELKLNSTESKLNKAYKSLEGLKTFRTITFLIAFLITLLLLFRQYLKSFKGFGS
jgi:hypothetical protein